MDRVGGSGKAETSALGQRLDFYPASTIAAADRECDTDRTVYNYTEAQTVPTSSPEFPWSKQQ